MAKDLLIMKMKLLMRSADLYEDVNQELQSGVMLKGGGGAERCLTWVRSCR